MKKIFVILICVTLSFSKNVSAQDLATRLAQNPCFVKLVNNFDLTLNVAKQSTSINNFSAEDLDIARDKDAYLSDVTGLPLDTVKNINKNIKDCYNNIKASVPELDQLTKGEIEVIFSEAIKFVVRTAGGEIGGGTGGNPERIVKNPDAGI